MDRRDFIKTTLISGTAVMAGLTPGCSPFVSDLSLFPHGERPSELWAFALTDDLNWDQKVALTCFQGLINRTLPRIYLIFSESDRFWLEYYRDHFGIKVHTVDSVDRLVRQFIHELNGYIVYDTAMPHSLNIATSLGAFENAVPVSRNLESYVSNLGLTRIDDLTGRWPDMYAAYDWSLENLLPRSNQKLMAQLCVHHPHWPTSTFTNRDYVIAHNILSMDISASERDKKDYNLLRKFYAGYPQESIVLGWHCVRDKEHEAIALSSEYGHYGLCSLNTSNLTVHTCFRPEEKVTYQQRAISKEKLKVENKVYIAYMATDGDAAWFVQNLINTDWANPQHGHFKYNWGFLPLAYDLQPAMVQYYFNNLTAADYFVAGPSGATYTYNHLHPAPEKFLRLTQKYMNKCGLKTVHMTNWNDRDWWQEVDLPGYHDTLRRNLPDCVGYVRGMGESAFEPHYLAGGKPYLFCGEGIHRGNDIYQTMKDFIDACPNRPLFIYNLVNHSIPIDELKTAMDRFPAGVVEVVHLDELLLLAEKAFDSGLITEDLYPDKSGIKQILSREARQAWPGFFSELQNFKTAFLSGKTKYLETQNLSPLGLEAVSAADFLAFESIWYAMKVVKLALESKGIYVNHKPTASERFLREFSRFSDAPVIQSLQDTWNTWHQQPVTYDLAEESAIHLVRLAESLNQKHFLKGEH
ncbi:MAG: hypothetical protein E4H13_02970 [Calditrichales bacterium]|nr:MAG: hypothetical protein E4H13_02970 [Calditrichales bacterium]